jgi:hypothetical protein
MDYAIRGLFHPLEEYSSISILTVGVLCSVFVLGCMIAFFFSESTSIRYTRFFHCDLDFEDIPPFPKFSSSYLVLPCAVCYTLRNFISAVSMFASCYFFISYISDHYVSVAAAIAFEEIYLCLFPCLVNQWSSYCVAHLIKSIHFYF